MTHDQSRNLRLLVALALLSLLVLVNLALTVRLTAHVERTCPNAEPERSLPCPAIPTRFVLDDPECAHKLLRAMNVTGVRVRAATLS